MRNVKVYRPDGETRAIWSRPFAANHRKHGVMPQRGSHVIAITEGKYAGYFHADLSPLAELTGKDEYRVCLGPFESHEEAVEEEQKWLLRNWVLAP